MKTYKLLSTALWFNSRILSNPFLKQIIFFTVCCKDLILKFNGSASSQESMKGEYKFNGDVLNDRFVFDNKKVDSSLSFHSGFSRWQVIILPFKLSKCLAIRNIIFIHDFLWLLLLAFRWKIANSQLFYRIIATKLALKTARNISGNLI